MSERFEVDDAVEIRPRERLGRWSKLALFAVVFGFAAQACTATAFFGQVAGFIMAGWIVAQLALARADGRVETRACADARGLHLAEGGEFARADIREAFVQPREAQRPLLCVRGESGRSVDLEVPTIEDARGFLRALDLDVSKQAASFVVHQGIFESTWLQRALVLLPAIAAWLTLNAHSPLAYLLVAVAVGLVVVDKSLRTRVKVGADGIYTESRIRRRFYPFSQIQSAELGDWGVDLHLRSGETRELRTRPRGDRREKDFVTAALLERIQEALAQRDERQGEPQAAALIARGERDVDAWLEGLERLKQGGYRIAALDEERLWKVVRDASAAPTARAGAAMLLRGTLDEEGRAKLRIAAEATALPRVRVVLEAAADPKREAELRAALEACTDDDALAAETSVRSAGLLPKDP